MQPVCRDKDERVGGTSFFLENIPEETWKAQNLPVKGNNVKNERGGKRKRIPSKKLIHCSPTHKDKVEKISMKTAYV